VSGVGGGHLQGFCGCHGSTHASLKIVVSPVRFGPSPFVEALQTTIFSRRFRAPKDGPTRHARGRGHFEVINPGGGGPISASRDWIDAQTRATVAAKADILLHECLFLRKGSLPKTPSGKIQRFRCRHMVATGRLDPIARVPLKQPR